MPDIDETTTWRMIHAERASMANIMATLTPTQWSSRSLCDGWTVQQTAGHIVVGAEQSTGKFVKGMVTNALRFNTMMDRSARRAGARPPSELVDRLQARLTTTNRPPAPPMTMLGEIVVHAQDICQPLGLDSGTRPDALLACLEMYKNASFPVGTKKRIEGLRLRASDVDWTHGTGPGVSGSASSMLLAMTGRVEGLDGLSGEGLATLRARMTTTPR